MFEEIFKMIFKMRNHYQENTSESKIIKTNNVKTNTDVIESSTIKKFLYE